MGWKKNGQQNKTRQEKKEEKMGKKEEEETGRNKAKQAKGVMGLMLWDVCGVRVAWFRCKTHTHTHIHKKGWESIYRRGNSSTYLTNHANRGAIIDKEGGRGRRRRRRMVGQVVGDSSSALLSLCLFPNNNALVLPSSIALQPPPSHPTKTLLLLHLLLLQKMKESFRKWSHSLKDQNLVKIRRKNIRLLKERRLDLLLLIRRKSHPLNLPMMIKNLLKNVLSGIIIIGRNTESNLWNFHLK